VKVFEASCQEGVTEYCGSEYWCTEDALLNSADSDKDVLRHRTESTTQEEDLKVVEYLGGKAV
jgi:hypothetical protein